MAEKVKKTLMDNATKRAKETTLKGEVAYAVSDGQVFNKATTAKKRKENAQSHAFNFAPVLQIIEVKGGMEPKKKK